MNKTLRNFETVLRSPVYGTKTPQEFRDKMKLAPFQKENSPEAWEGHVMEFCTELGGPVGTLCEFEEHDKCDVFQIMIGDFKIEQQDRTNIVLFTVKRGYQRQWIIVGEEILWKAKDRV